MDERLSVGACPAEVWESRAIAGTFQVPRVEGHRLKGVVQRMKVWDVLDPTFRGCGVKRSPGSPMTSNVS